MYGGRYVLTLQRLLVEVAAVSETSVDINIINVLYYIYNIYILYNITVIIDFLASFLIDFIRILVLDSSECFITLLHSSVQILPP
jgi:hypothetical protein